MADEAAGADVRATDDGRRRVATLTASRPGQPDVEYLLGIRPLAIGSAADCDIVVDSPGVSPRQAEIELLGEDFILEELDAGELLVNGTPIAGSHVLAPGDKIRIGEETLLFTPAAPDGPLTQVILPGVPPSGPGPQPYDDASPLAGAKSAYPPPSVVLVILLAAAVAARLADTTPGDSSGPIGLFFIISCPIIAGYVIVGWRIGRNVSLKAMWTRFRRAPAAWLLLIALFVMAMPGTGLYCLPGRGAEKPASCTSPTTSTTHSGLRP